MFAIRRDDAHAKFVALDQTQAIIELLPDGTIVRANANFLSTMGYTIDEIRGQQYGIFVDPDYRGSTQYRSVWEGLRSGAAYADEFRCLAKGGREVWVQASFNPVRDRAGRVVKIVKLAIDITMQKARRR